MDEESQERTTITTRTRIHLVDRIFRLIKDNSLEEIKQIFETLQPEQSIQVLNSTINGFTPFYVAVNNNVEISRYLFKISLRQGPQEMTKGWRNGRHPLIGAILFGNQEMIQLILEHLSGISEKINDASPLMMATSLGDLTSVKLLVDMGADINRSYFKGRSTLMESTSNSDICRFLLHQGANVFHQDEDGLTALHIAVARQHLQSVIYLVNAGANVRIRCHEGITPLIVAAINIDMPALRYLMQQPAYSVLDIIESLEILNVCIICHQEAIIEPWLEALRVRRGANLPKNRRVPAQEILDFSQEFISETQLENLQGNFLRLAFQGVLVVERILGRNNRLYMMLLLQTTLIAKRETHMKKVRQLIDYIQVYYQEASVFFVTTNTRSFKSLFNEFNDPNKFYEYGAFAIFNLIAQAAVKIWIRIKDDLFKNPCFIDRRYSEIVDTFLYMTSTIKTDNFSQLYLKQFWEVVTNVVRMGLRLRLHRSIMQRAIKLMNTTSWGSVKLIRILLESGANANSKDCFRRTPIMFAVKHVPQDKFNEVLVLLEEYGGHADCRDSEGFTAMDYTHWGRILIAPIQPLTLGCLATGVILDNEIPYGGILPKILEDFVNFHK